MFSFLFLCYGFANPFENTQHPLFYSHDETMCTERLSTLTVWWDILSLDKMFVILEICIRFYVRILFLFRLYCKKKMHVLIYNKTSFIPSAFQILSTLHFVSTLFHDETTAISKYFSRLFHDDTTGKYVSNFCDNLALILPDDDDDDNDFTYG